MASYILICNVLSKEIFVFLNAYFEDIWHREFLTSEDSILNDMIVFLVDDG